jgi:hypothetical protein
MNKILRFQVSDLYISHRYLGLITEFSVALILRRFPATCTSEPQIKKENIFSCIVVHVALKTQGYY